MTGVQTCALPISYVLIVTIPFSHASNKPVQRLLEVLSVNGVDNIFLSEGLAYSGISVAIVNYDT